MNKLYIYKDSMIYLGKSIPKKIHSHHAIQIFIAISEPLVLYINDKEVKCNSGIIDSDTPHQCIKEDVDIVFINIDPESEVGLSLKHKYLAETNFLEFSGQIFKSLLDLLSAPASISNPKRILSQFIEVPTLATFDKRIGSIIDFLCSNISEPISTKMLSELVFLSEDRLLHLFKEQIGIPIRKYLYWLKIRKAISMISEGASLTDVAYETGFSDASHFNRIFARMFGMAPSSFLKHSSFVQVEAVYEL